MNSGPATARLLTPPGRGGIAVIALAGEGAAAIVADIFRPLASHRTDVADQLRLGHLVDGGAVLDEAVLCRRGDRYEINIHGGPLVARKVLDLLAARSASLDNSPAPDAGPAHPKWNNPAIGAELLAALPLAKSPRVLALLSRQWSAGISELARRASRAGLVADLRRAADGLPLFDKLLRPQEVVLLGPTNAGKSTLINALVGRQVSLVHERAGTTRDWVREEALLQGVPVWLTDTAGLWHDACGIDAEAVRRSRQRALSADLVLLLSPSDPPRPPAWLQGKPLLTVETMCDLHAPAGRADAAISAPTGAGLDRLKHAILQTLGLADLPADAPLAFTPRQARLLRELADAVETENPSAQDETRRHLLQGC